jgi:hypothetical protein
MKQKLGSALTNRKKNFKTHVGVMKEKGTIKLLEERSTLERVNTHRQAVHILGQGSGNIGKRF